jgi:hypothetical protein
MPLAYLQWYANVPAVSNVTEKVPPGGIGPEFQRPSSLVEVCEPFAWLTQVTVPPTLTLTIRGLNLMWAMVT